MPFLVCDSDHIRRQQHHGGKYLLLLAKQPELRVRAARVCALPRSPAINGQTLMGINLSKRFKSTTSLSLFSWACMHACIRVVVRRDMVLLISLQFFRCFLDVLDNHHVH
jgi:hypothetical protein